MYTVSLDSDFALFLAKDAMWGKRTKAQPLRGLTDDGTSVPAKTRGTAQQKFLRDIWDHSGQELHLYKVRL